MIFEAKDLVIGYDEPLTRPFDISMERGEKVVLKGLQRNRKDYPVKEYPGPDPGTFRQRGVR